MVVYRAEDYNTALESHVTDIWPKLLNMIRKATTCQSSLKNLWQQISIITDISVLIITVVIGVVYYTRRLLRWVNASQKDRVRMRERKGEKVKVICPQPPRTPRHGRCALSLAPRDDRVTKFSQVITICQLTVTISHPRSR